MQLDKLFKRYVWDDTKTPYLTSVTRLTRTQANYEVYAYTLFLGIFFAVVAFTSTSSLSPHGQSMGVAFYAFSIVCAAIIFGFTKDYYAALYCAATPLAAGVYLLTFGFPPSLGWIDYAVILGFLALALRYSLRVVAIGRHYEHMPAGGDAPSDGDG